MDRRQFLGTAAACGVLTGCGGGGDGDDSPMPPPDAQIDRALAALDTLAADLMKKSGVPGLAVAVVRGSEKVYAKGFGVADLHTGAAVDADTIFQLASVSKSVGATVVARQVGFNRVQWDTPIRSSLPWFALKDPAVTQAVTVGDMYAHRCGLGKHAGDHLEDMGYDRREVLERLRYESLTGFRTTYHYGNFDLTAGAEAVATAVGVDWATLSASTLYAPLGMTRTTSRYAEFAAASNRARGHVIDGNGTWVLSPQRRDADAQSPAGGVSSSVNDMARWLTMMLGNGTYQGTRLIDAAALAQATSPQIVVDERGSYGFGFNVGNDANGRPSYSHSGAFALGAATCFKVVPSTGLAIVALTNGSPIGVPETLVAEFFDLVEAGAIQRDWYELFRNALAEGPSGSLVGVPPPADPVRPARPLSGYAGVYANIYYGPATIALVGGALQLEIGPAPIRVPLSHWDGEIFVFHLENENALPGTISKATFDGETVTLEYYSANGFGTFTRG